MNVTLLFQKILLLLVLMLVSSPVHAAAQNQQAVPDSLRGSFDFVQNTVRQAAGVKDIGDAPRFIRQVLAIFLTIVAVIAVAAIIWGGFVYVTSAGEEDKARKAKLVILYAIIGLLIIGAAGIITNVVINIYAK